MVLGGVIIAVEGQDAPAQPVHDVPARRLEDHVLGEVYRQGPELGEDGIEIGELLPGGQGAEEQEVGGLLEAEAALGGEAVDQVLHVDAPVNEPALHGGALAVLDVVALDVADLGDARHDAGAVGVPEPPLHVDVFIMAGIDVVMLLEFSA